MLTKTSESGIKALMFVALREGQGPLSPRRVAEQLGTSPSYTAKVLNLLVKAGILQAHRGARGGVTLERSPGEILLREVVEACQGQVTADHCRADAGHAEPCAFHRAMKELHDAILGVLTTWTLADLISTPCPLVPELEAECRMAGLRSSRGDEDMGNVGSSH